jgi:hypothetical protein
LVILLPLSHHTTAAGGAGGGAEWPFKFVQSSHHSAVVDFRCISSSIIHNSDADADHSSEVRWCSSSSVVQQQEEHLFWRHTPWRTDVKVFESDSEAFDNTNDNSSGDVI